MLIDTTSKEHALGDHLERIAEALDITPSQQEMAETAYNGVANWLGAEGSPLARFQPTISPQGSMLLGTVTKPFKNEVDFDVDLLLLLLATKEQISQEQLKKMVGDRLKANERYAKMLLDEKRRCWTLDYAEESRFHLDAVPSIPRLLSGQSVYQLGEKPLANGVLITDNVEKKYCESDPIGYANWFKSRQITFLNENRVLLEKAFSATIEEIPVHKFRTPLQRAIQILKRFRDVQYGDDENRPISIIITTLAALAYGNQANLYDALSGIIARMKDGIKTKDGVYWVENPVNPKENFADKWQDYPERAKEFFKWIKNVETLLMNMVVKTGLQEQSVELTKAFGNGPVNEAMKRMGNSYREHRESGSLFLQKDTRMLSHTGEISVPNHRFYGKD